VPTPSLRWVERFRPFFWSVVLSVTLNSRATELATAPSQAADHPHAAASVPNSASGIRPTLIAGVTERDFLKLGDKPKTVRLLVVATWTDDNYGMNFNGHSRGGALYTVPKGWTVEVTYINPGPVPHSLIVIEKSALKKIQIPEPYFKGAAVPNHVQGMSYDRASFTFTPGEAGEFALACGFPTHALNGHWIGLDIAEDASEPTLKLGDKPVMKATR
jgi:Sulfocyanin (SoxE) domain